MATLADPLRQMLEGRRYALLATHNADGSIHVTPVWYLLDDGKFYIESLSSDRKARNAAARPDATIIVDVRQPGRERWVYASGVVRVVRGDESREINARILRRYLTDKALADPVVGPVFAAAVDATICLTPEVWRSWSLQDWDEQFFGSVLASSHEKWFRPVEA